jgi:RsiW-degrading membrane proteinase PrsW (M82 family)
MKYCRHCGFQVDDKAQFCRHCGTKLVPTQADVTYLSHSQRIRGWNKTKTIIITIIFTIGSILAVLFFENPAIMQNFGVGIIEEIAKLIGPIFIATQAPYYLKTKNSTLTLAVASALTFALLEDALYIFVYGVPLSSRLFTLPLHLLWTGIAAFGVSLAVMKVRNEPELKRNFFRAYLTEGPISLLIIAIVLHAAWDLSAVIPVITVYLICIGFVYALSILTLIQTYRHFPQDMTTYRYTGVAPMLKKIIGL